MANRWSILFVFGVVPALSDGMESAKIYMKRADFGDQAASETGYVFEANSGEPSPYSAYENEAGRGSWDYQQLPITKGLYDTGAQQFASGWPWGSGSGQYYSQDYSYVPYAYAYPGLYTRYQVPKYYGYQGSQDGDTSLNKYGAVQFPNDDLNRYGSSGASSSQGDSFLKGAGQKFDTSKQSSHGEKGDSGYKKVDAFDKGTRGSHDNEDHKGFYASSGGDKKSQHDSGERYGKKEEAAKGNKGESFSQSKSHKKGSKTTGYHKVYHKDEYKKDHSFYDEADSKGHYDKHENFKANHAASSGASEKGAKSVSGHSEREKGVKDFTDKGRRVDNSSGFKKAQGEQSYHNDQSEYAKKAGKEESGQKGFSERQGDGYAV